MDSCPLWFIVKQTIRWDIKDWGYNVSELVSTIFSHLLHKSAKVVIREKSTERWREHSTGRVLFNLQLKSASHKYVSRSVSCSFVICCESRMDHITMRQYLHRFHLSDSPLCTACGEIEETLEQVLHQCKVH